MGIKPSVLADRLGQDTVRLAFSAALYVLLVPAMIYLPPLVRLALPVAVLVGLALLANPTAALFAVFGLRVVVDTLWWIKGGVFGLNVMELYSGMVAGFAALLCVLNAEKIQRHGWFFPFLGYLLLVGISASQVAELRSAVELVAKYLSPVLLMFLVTTQFRRGKDRQALVWMILALSIVPILVGYYELARGQMNEEVLNGLNRLRGAYQNIHNHAHAMALFITMAAFAFRVTPHRGWRLALGVYAAACTGLLYLTYVRTPLVGLLVFALIFLVLERRFKLLFGAGVVVFLLLTTSAVLQSRFSDIALLLHANPGHDTRVLGSGRVAIWTDTWAAFRRQDIFHQLFGIGLGEQGKLQVDALDAHNDYLAMVYQMGPLSVVLYLALQVQVAAGGIWLSRHGRDEWSRVFGRYMAALSGLVFITNFLSNSYVARVNVAWLFWGLCGLLYATVAAHREPNGDRA